LSKTNMALKTNILFEACVDCVEAAVAAQEGGAGRVELCAALLEGGLTPSDGTIRLAKQQLHIPVHVIIRPRGGDFLYSGTEFEVMKLDVERCKALGADGVVIGILNPDGTIDEERTAKLIALARPMKVTFHRAFDMTRDPFEALETLIALDVERILTSGQEDSAYEGLDLICELVAKAQGRIIIMPGAGITEKTIGKIVAQSGVTEIHATAFVSQESAMQFRNARCYMGGILRPPEFSLQATSAEKVTTLLKALD
jgi:copper homeostasis protein